MGATVAESAAADRLLTEAVGLVDRSERGKLALTGPQAKELLSGQVTNDIEALAPGTGCYAALLTHKGKMLADLRILDTGDELWLDTERAGLQALFDSLRRGAVGWDAQLHKRTLEQALLSLVGPGAEEAVGGAVGPEHANRRAQLGGADVLLVATDLGVDVVCSARGRRRASAARSTSPRCPRRRPRSCASSPGARATASTSTTPTIPQEAGLNDRAVSFTKGCYVGQETVARLHYRGKPNRHLRGLRLSTAGAERGRRSCSASARSAAWARACVSPRLGPIALALVRREAGVGDSSSRATRAPSSRAAVRVARARPRHRLALTASPTG